MQTLFKHFIQMLCSNMTRQTLTLIHGSRVLNPNPIMRKMKMLKVVI
ncbi:hypothetical protein Golax_003628 [Gossypium laxum]|uniref:Uncharacterized protein n=1 Tax=Gossypium laxum TaxID=34288 RepID=A0A7J9AG45_9ROSI|nr:hypothetical protein [Gossypium laxum]